MTGDAATRTEFHVTTRHGGFRLLPYGETLVGVDNQGLDPFTVNRVKVRFTGWIEWKDGRWQVSSPQDLDVSRVPPAGVTRHDAAALPARSRERLTELVCAAVSGWAAEHAELLVDFERRMLAIRIDDIRRQITNSEENIRRLRAELLALERRAAAITPPAPPASRRSYRRARRQPRHADTVPPRAGGR